MRIRMSTLAVTTALTLSTAVIPAQAFDLTGHWTGKWSCKGFAAPFTRDGKLVNKYTTGQSQSTLDITRSGSTFAAVIDLGNGTFTYNGYALNNAKDDTKGEAILLGCTTGNTLPSANTGVEILRAVVKTKDDKASFKAVSIFADDFPEVETCKYSFKRIDTVDPGVSACP